MRKLNPTAAIGRALIQARHLTRDDLQDVIAECAESPQVPEHRRCAAYIEETYAALAGEDRRYLTTCLKRVLATMTPTCPTHPGAIAGQCGGCAAVADETPLGEQIDSGAEA